MVGRILIQNYIFHLRIIIIRNEKGGGGDPCTVPNNACKKSCKRSYHLFSFIHFFFIIEFQTISLKLIFSLRWSWLLGRRCKCLVFPSRERKTIIQMCIDGDDEGVWWEKVFSTRPPTISTASCGKCDNGNIIVLKKLIAYPFH